MQLNVIYLVISSFSALALGIVALRQILNSMRRKWDQDKLQTKATQDNTKALQDLTAAQQAILGRLQSHDGLLATHEARLNDHESRIRRPTP